MTDDRYTPPRVWTWDADGGGRFASINRPIAGATAEKALPSGEHRFQLHSLATPNGVKVTLMLEELLELGHSGAEYDAWPVNIMSGDQFGSGFVDINPNSKIPALLDTQTGIRLFESASIMMYLSEEFGAFLPENRAARAEVINWLFWVQGSAPFLGGGFGHFYAYAPEKWQYPIDRYTMEVKRQLDVLNRELSDHEYLGGDQYSIADMAAWPWYGALCKGLLYEAGEFLQVEHYEHVQRWTKAINARPAAQRGIVVNRVWGDENRQLAERHGAADFEALNL